MAKKKTTAKKKVASADNPYRGLLKGVTVALSGNLDVQTYGLREHAEQHIKSQGGKLTKTIDANLNILIADKASSPDVKKAKRLNQAGEANIQIAINQFEILFPGIRERLARDLADPKQIERMVELLYWKRSLLESNPIWIRKHDFSGHALGHKKKAVTHVSQINFDSCKFNKTKFKNIDFGLVGDEEEFVNCKINNATVDGLGVDPKKCTFKTCRGQELKLYDPIESKFDELVLQRLVLCQLPFSGNGFALVDKCEFKNCKCDSLVVGEMTQTVAIRNSKFTNCQFSGFQSGKVTPDPQLFRLENCKLNSLNFGGGNLEEISFTKCQIDKSDIAELQFESMQFAKSTLKQCSFQKLKGGLLDLRGANLTKCKIIDCEIDVIRIDEKQKGYLQGLEDCSAVIETAGYPRVCELASVIKKAEQVKIEFESTIHGKGKQVVTVGISKKKNMRFSRSRLVKGLDLWGSRKEIQKTVESELPLTSPIKELVFGLLWLIRSSRINELILNSLDVGMKKGPCKTKELKELMLAAVAEIQSSATPIESTVPKTRSNAPRQLEYHDFAQRLSNRFDSERIFAALDAFNKRPVEMKYRFKEGELAVVFIPDPKKNRKYICSFQSDGVYNCCTESLKSCGGLRGAPCKHLIMVLIALAKYKKLSGDLEQIIEGYQRGKKQLPTSDRELIEQILDDQGKRKGWKSLTTKPGDFPKNKSWQKARQWSY